VVIELSLLVYLTECSILAIDDVSAFCAVCVGLVGQEYHIITGRGNHSQDNQPKIKPAVKEFLNDNQYT